MTMSHRAYAFDHAAFRSELSELLLRALQANETNELATWIDAHRSRLTDPYQGEPLEENWRDALEPGDVHEHGDLALTHFYDSELDIGLDTDWESIAELLEKSGSSGALTLGSALGPEEAPFDPGRQGAYFQTEAEVQQGLRDVRALLERHPLLAEPLAPLEGMLSQAARRGQGLYVTF
jgi:hypothetical protein